MRARPRRRWRRRRELRARGTSCAVLRGARGEDVSQAPETHRAAIHDLEARIGEECGDLLRFHVPVADEMPEGTVPLTLVEIDREHASARSRDPAHLAGALDAGAARQVAQHQGARLDAASSSGPWDLLSAPDAATDMTSGTSV